MVYAIVAAWLVARHPEHSDDELEALAQKMAAQANRWIVGYPVLAHCSRLYDAALAGRQYSPPGAEPTYPTGAY